MPIQKIEEASSEIGEASCFSRRVSTRHTQTQLCGNHGQFVKAPIPDIEEAPVFFSLVSTRHVQTQLCGNHGQFVEAPIPDIEEAPVFFSLVKHLSYAHSICANHGQFVEDFCKADIQNLSSSPRMPSQRSLSGHSVFLIPWGTSASQ
ncbi:hypothetical protein ACFX10_000321 [Malus domestica]